jgi:hypothetical protein
MTRLFSSFSEKNEKNTVVSGISTCCKSNTTTKRLSHRIHCHHLINLKRYTVHLSLEDEGISDVLSLVQLIIGLFQGGGGISINT